MIKKILTYPNKHLSIPTKKVDNIDDEVKSLVVDMLETMYSNNGVGLAANQIGSDKRILVMNIDKQIIMINPVIVFKSPTLIAWREGCLSFPGWGQDTKRHYEIDVDYLDTDGNLQVTNLQGFASVCAQHEIDHLDGKTFIDHESEDTKVKVRMKVTARKVMDEQKELLKRLKD